MAEMAPEQGGEPGGGNFLTRRFGGIPGWLILAGAGVIAYLVFFRNKSSSGSASSSGGGGTSTTGDIQLQPGTETIDLSGTSSPTTSIANPAPVEPEDNDVGQPSQTGTPNPQPTPSPPPRTKHHVTKVGHKAGPGTEVTVAKWPGKSVNGLAQWNTTLWGIAQHYHTTVPELLKLNPQIKNANLIFPGQKIKVP